jgi:hypothetical protein
MKTLTFGFLFVACILFADFVHAAPIGNWSGPVTAGNPAICTVSEYKIHITISGTKLTIANDKANCLSAQGTVVTVIGAKLSTFQIIGNKLYLNKIVTGSIEDMSITLVQTHGAYGFNETYVVQNGGLQLHKALIANISLDGILKATSHSASLVFLVLPKRTGTRGFAADSVHHFPIVH